MDFGDARVLRVLVAMASFVIIVAGMKAASGILVPFLLALFVCVISTPFLVGLQRFGIPNFVAIPAILLVIVVAGLGVVAVFGASVSDFTVNLPEYEERATTETRDILLRIEQWGFQLPSDEIVGWLNPDLAVRNLGGMLTGMGSTFGSAFLVGFMVLFMMLEAANFPNKFKRFVGNDMAAVEGLYKAVADIRHYMAIKTVLSFLTASLVALMLKVIGVSYPLLWGVLAFLFEFVPSIGSIIAAAPAVALAFIELGFWPAAYTVTGYLAINLSLGNFLEPRIVGHGLGLSPLIVILSLFFWGWVLGPVGMLLSVPLTMVVKIALNSNEPTRRFAMLMGPEIRESRSAQSIRKAAKPA